MVLDEVGTQNFFQQTHNLFIEPELERRRKEGLLPQNFQIRECLIRLPKAQPPVVEFNEEFGWLTANPKLAPNVELEKLEAGKPIYSHELIDIGKILPPEVNGIRVAFVYLFWNGFSYSAIFDFSPNDPFFDAEHDEFRLGEAIANHLRRKFLEVIVRLSRNQQAALRQIGLWVATPLLPHPLSKILERVGTGDIEEARAILVEHCNTQFIEDLIETWKPINVFNLRMALFREAVFAHANSKFHLTIYTLIPQIEGVITDWLYEMRFPTIKWSAESKVRQFRDAIVKLPDFDFAYREALESVAEFLLDGPPLQRFTNWLGKMDESFPGRHHVTHGRYIDTVFTEENSIKLFLLLDTICQFMMFYEAGKTR